VVKRTISSMYQKEKEAQIIWYIEEMVLFTT